MVKFDEISFKIKKRKKRMIEFLSCPTIYLANK